MTDQGWGRAQRMELLDPEGATLAEQDERGKKGGKKGKEKAPFRVKEEVGYSRPPIHRPRARYRPRARSRMVTCHRPRPSFRLSQIILLYETPLG